MIIRRYSLSARDYFPPVDHPLTPSFAASRNAVAAFCASLDGFFPGKKNAARPNRTTGVVMVNLNSDATPAAMSLVGTSHRGGETLDMVVIAETAGTATAGTATAGTANGTAEAVRGLSRLGVRTADTILGIPETVVATRATNAATTEARPVMIQGEAAGVGDPAGKSKERQEQVMYA